MKYAILGTLTFGLLFFGVCDRREKSLDKYEKAVTVMQQADDILLKSRGYDPEEFVSRGTHAIKALSKYGEADLLFRESELLNPVLVASVDVMQQAMRTNKTEAESLLAKSFRRSRIYHENAGSE